MKKIDLKAYAKINLCLDVKGLLPGGFHEVEMIMQQILLCDDVSMAWEPDADGEFNIELRTNRNFLPTDERNLAYKAALLMKDEFGEKAGGGNLRIFIKKRIPVAAGLAGGSSNGAAVLHGLNVLWDLNLSVAELNEVGAKLGSDVPFCIMGQAAETLALKKRFRKDPLACHCALATGRGTDLKPLTGLRSHLVLSKPAVSVSTAEVYRGIDNEEIPERPNVQEMIEALKIQDMDSVEKNMINVLENFTLKRYPIVVYTKDKMQSKCNPAGVLMSGSGPTVFGLCGSIDESKRICREMEEENRESFWTRTTY